MFIPPYVLRPQRRVRIIFAEKNMKSWGRAETAVKLIDKEFSVEDSIEAAGAYGDMERSLGYLRQECPVCMDTKTMSQVNIFNVSFCLCCRLRCVVSFCSFLSFGSLSLTCGNKRLNRKTTT